jgi:hypothetical protein
VVARPWISVYDLHGKAAHLTLRFKQQEPIDEGIAAPWGAEEAFHADEARIP